LSAGGISSISNQALNGQLQNAINQLQRSAQARPAPAPAGPPPVCPQGYHDALIVNGWPRLDSCAQGEAVHTLWSFLIDRHYTRADSYIQGKYGPETEAAVGRFQRDSGLPQDGIVGPQTWQALVVTIQEGDEKQSVGALMRQFIARGLDYVVPPDIPIFGRALTADVENYQQSHGLAVDGVVGPQTWQSLLSGN
jgi:peptidoglycan hydrolase-like protein with peptidoglycan-binding domain